LFLVAAGLTGLLFAGRTCGQHNGFLRKDRRTLFPIGFYELPKDDAKLEAMANAGVNLVRCRSRADLDRLAAFDMMGVLPVAVTSGVTDKLNKTVESVRDHPALAAWEGPDEVVWGFTANSALHRKGKVHKTPFDWWLRRPGAVKYAEERARQIMPKLRLGIARVRELDTHRRPFWINEAMLSDAKYVGQYLGSIDITGCDIYPIKKNNRGFIKMTGWATDRWKQVGRGKPVWVVLQAFAWSELGDYHGIKETAHPTFVESRFMAYDVIVHGARGILYWGSRFLKSEPFRESIYALTSELAALQPFLVASDVSGVDVKVVDDQDSPGSLRVRVLSRRYGDDWLLILVNEDLHRSIDVKVVGLGTVNGRRLDLLYGNEAAVVDQGGFTTRMCPLEVKVYATGRKWETLCRKGRSFVDCTISPLAETSRAFETPASISR
jgi:hypothetical protein